MDRKVILFIAMSLDGYIAKPDDNIGFLDKMNVEGEDYGYSTFIETVDTIILGRRTYDKLLSMGVEAPYGERKVFVLTKKQRQSDGNISFYSGEMTKLISSIKKSSGKNIYCDGGAETIWQMLNARLIDEMIISVVPILLGDGIRLFGRTFPENELTLIKSKTFEKGLVQLHYAIN